MKPLSDEALRELRNMGDIGMSAASEILRLRAFPASESDAVAGMRKKLRQVYAELERRRRRDVEIARYLPVIAARLQAISAEATFAVADSEPKQSWENDPEIDWTGIEGAPR